MPQIGPLEVMLVAVIALIVFGPQRLPEIAKSLGRGIAEFRRQASDIRAEFESGLDDGPEDEKPAPTAVRSSDPGTPETGSGTSPQGETTAPPGSASP